MPWITSPSGGASLPIPSTQDFGGGPTSTVGNGGNANLGLGSSFGPNSLLDLTDPTQPTVKKAGIYAVAANVAAETSMTEGGYFELQITLDANGLDLAVSQDSRTATVAQPLPQSAQMAVGYIPQGGVIIVKIHNKDGAASIDFAISSFFIQRIT